MVRQDFYDQLTLSEVGREYLSLVSECKNRFLIPEQGYEIHHVYPTSLGGTNTNDNKVKFTVFEHCKAHALLAQAIPCYKTLQPLTRMSNGQVNKLADTERITLDELYHWSELREKALHHPKSPEHIEKNRATHLGKKLSQEHIDKRTAKRLGTVTVTDGIVTKYIPVNELEQWELKGWRRGISEDRRKKLKESHTGIVGNTVGRITMHLGDKEIKVKPEEVKLREIEGYTTGRAEKFAKNHSERMKGKTNLGKVRINKGGVGKLVSKDLLDFYMGDGWKLGLVKHK